MFKLTVSYSAVLETHSRSFQLDIQSTINNHLKIFILFGARLSWYSDMFLPSSMRRPKWSRLWTPLTGQWFLLLPARNSGCLGDNLSLVWVFAASSGLQTAILLWAIFMYKLLKTLLMLELTEKFAPHFYSNVSYTSTAMSAGWRGQLQFWTCYWICSDASGGKTN